MCPSSWHLALLATKSGSTGAEKNRDIAAGAMTAADISKAQDLARACVQKNLKGCWRLTTYCPASFDKPRWAFWIYPRSLARKPITTHIILGKRFVHCSYRWAADSLWIGRALSKRPVWGIVLAYFTDTILPVDNHRCLEHLWYLAPCHFWILPD